MNRTQFFTLSGALLASTAMATVASAGSIGTIADGSGAGSGAISTTTISIANNIFSTTAATANALQFPSAGSLGTARHLAVSYTNLFPNTGRTRTFININGANFNTGLTPQASLLIKNGSGSFIATISAASVGTAICSSVTPINTQISLIDCGLATLFTANLTSALGAVGTIGSGSIFFGGLQLSGIIFTNASGLATVGNTITLSGSVLDTANQSLESLTSGALITSAAGVTTPTVTAGAAAVVLATTTPTAFLSFNSGPASVGTAGLTLTLATVNLTNSAAVNTDLATVITAQNQVSGVTISVTSTILSQVSTVSLPVATVSTTSTVANFSGGTATFAINNADVDGIAAAGVTGISNAINVLFSGSVAIAAAAAGTVSITAAADTNASQTGGGRQAPAAGSGATTQISQGGFAAEINTFQSSAGGTNFQAFVRIHNNGTNAGTVTITVRNNATGATLGTMTSSSIPSNASLQLSAANIESGAGILTPSGQYTLSFSGPITGYVQHLMLNGTNNAFSDLSGFRLGSGTNRP